MISFGQRVGISCTQQRIRQGTGNSPDERIREGRVKGFGRGKGFSRALGKTAFLNESKCVNFLETSGSFLGTTCATLRMRTHVIGDLD